MKKYEYPQYYVDPVIDFKNLFSVRAVRLQDKPAFCFAKRGIEHTVTYRQLYDDISGLGTSLYSMGIRRQHVAMIGENCYEWALLYYTMLGSDCVFVPLDKDLPENELIHILNDSDSTVIFFTKSFEKFFDTHRECFPAIEKYICFAEEVGPEDFINAYDMLENGKSLIAQGVTTFTEDKPDMMSLAEILYTSGTTGVAKGVMLSRHNVAMSISYSTKYSRLYSTCLSILPYHHCYESISNVLNTLDHDGTVYINENLKTVASNFKKYKPEFVMLVPMFLENFYKKIWKELEKKGKADTVRRMIKISNGLRKAGIDLRFPLFKEIRAVFGGNLKKIVSGGAPIRKELREFYDSIGIVIVSGYGITECSPLVSASRDEGGDLASVGPPIPCIEVKVDNPDENGEGEFMVKGDIVMMGYYKNPEATKAAITEDGWFHTGDNGKIENGLLYITGRKKNIIVLKNGKNIYPEEIENYISLCSGVQEVVVTSLKDDAGEETGLCAMVYPDPALFETMDKDRIKKYIEEQVDEVLKPLPSYKHIVSLIIRDTEFPKTTTKKIKRKVIEKENNAKK